LREWLEGLELPPPHYQGTLLIERSRLQSFRLKKSLLGELFGDKRFSVPRSSFASPDVFVTRFEELASAGYEWLHFVALGVADNHLLVSVDFPLKARGIPRAYLAVNMAGPLSGPWVPEFKLV
jgi:hypothetical protein